MTQNSSYCTQTLTLLRCRLPAYGPCLFLSSCRISCLAALNTHSTVPVKYKENSEMNIITKQYHPVISPSNDKISSHLHIKCVFLLGELKLLLHWRCGLNVVLWISNVRILQSLLLHVSRWSLLCYHLCVWDTGVVVVRCRRSKRYFACCPKRAVKQIRGYRRWTVVRLDLSRQYL